MGINQVYALPMHADLHTHSTASDGTLTPAELIAQAEEAGVTLLSITDHDTVAAYAGLPEPTGELRIIPGIELSSRWRKIGIHVVGLNIDPAAPAIAAAVTHQQRIRSERAAEIARRLDKLGFHGTLEGARACAGAAVIGRPHFARYLAASGQLPNEQQAFRKYLGQGKRCNVKETWPELDVAIGWIKAAGGSAVLAHPAKYKQTNMRLEELTGDFAAAGGDALEAVSGQQLPTLTHRLTKLAARHQLAVSCGSDFHGPGQNWAALGKAPGLPAGCTAVWDQW